MRFRIRGKLGSTDDGDGLKIDGKINSLLNVNQSENWTIIIIYIQNDIGQ